MSNGGSDFELENGDTKNDLEDIHGSASISTGNNGYLVQRPLDAPSAAILHATVASSENEDAVEIPCDPFGNLPLNILQIEFPGATGLKYRNPDTGNFRMIAPFEMNDVSVLAPPTDGWDGKLFIACLPQAAAKRPYPDGGGSGIFNSPYPDGGGSGIFDSPSMPKRGGGIFPQSSMPNPGFGLPSGFGGNISVVPSSKSFGMRGPGGGGFPGRSRPPGPGRGGGFPDRGARGPPGMGRGRGAGPPSAGPNTFDYCTLCDAKLNSQNQCDLHYSGKKHAENLAIQASGGIPIRMGRGGRGGPGRGGPGRGAPRGRGFASNEISSNFVPTGVGRGSQMPPRDFQNFDY